MSIANLARFNIYIDLRNTTRQNFLREAVMEDFTRESTFHPNSDPFGDGVRFSGDETPQIRSKNLGFSSADESAISQARKAALELKERYRAETDFLRQKLGSLEQIRRDLGLSQRKMSELLLVDPASWNRWVKQDRAPSYIYKSLQWFLALRDRNPEIASLAWLKTHSTERNTLYLEERIEELSRQIELLKRQAPQTSERPSVKLAPPNWVFIALGVALGFSLCYGLLRLF
jgi:transcriptional regulator with XRE-family HTH domain